MEVGNKRGGGAFLWCMKKLAVFVAVVGVSAFIASADSSPAYNFLNVSQSTTGYGLGGLNISTVEDDVNNMDMNPALLGPEMEKQIGLNYMHYIGGSNFAGVKFANGIGENSGWGVGLQYFGYGSMKMADEGGIVSGEFSPKDMALSGYYSRDIAGNWRGGVALKFLYSDYEQYNAIAIATDLGVNYYNPDNDMSFSFVIANLGGQVKRFTDSYDRLPFDMRMGITKGLGSSPIRFSVTAWNLTKWKLPYLDAGDGTEGNKPEIKDGFASNLFRHLIFGLDYVPSDRFRLGLGYNYKTRTDMATYSRSFLSGFSACVGFRVKMFNLGVAFAQPHKGATTLMLNITTSINDFIR